MSEGMTALNRIRFGDRTALRGPRPPELVCRECGETVAAEFENGVLAALKKIGLYDGETTGGVGVCPACDKTRQERLARFKGESQTEVLDLPVRERDSTLDNFEARPGVAGALAIARDWLKRINSDLYFFGVTGTGKTRLAVSLAREVLTRKLVAGPVVYARVPTLIRRLKEAQFDQERSAGVLGKISFFASAGLLVLDDLGAENGTAYTRTTVEGLYNDRLDAGRPTILTSNLPLGLSLVEQAKPPEERLYRESLGDFLGDDRMASRIAGNAEIVELGGQDYRLHGWKRVRGGR